MAIFFIDAFWLVRRPPRVDFNEHFLRGQAFLTLISRFRFV